MKLRLFGPGGRVWRLAFRIKHTAKSLKYRQLYNIRGGGKNKNLYFYVIGITMKNEGFFSMVNKTRAHIIYALDNGLTPVVNWRDSRIHTCATMAQTHGNTFLSNPAGIR